MVPWALAGHWAFSSGGGASKDGWGTGPAGPLVWLPRQSPKEVWARGAFAVGSGPTASLASSCVSSLSSKLMADPRKPQWEWGSLWHWAQRGGDRGPWVWAGVKVPAPLPLYTGSLLYRTWGGGHEEGLKQDQCLQNLVPWLPGGLSPTTTPRAHLSASPPSP